MNNQNLPAVYLNFIMKNEAKVLTRMLTSVIPVIDGCVCIDTGSTDNSKEIVENFFKEHNKPCKIVDHPFVDFEDARNFAIEEIKGRCDYAFWLDCDEVISIAKDFNLTDFKKQLSGHDSAILEVNYNGTEYGRINFFKTHKGFKWKGKVHEYLMYPPDVKMFSVKGIAAVVYSDGASWENQLEKYRSHAAILEKEVALTNDPRDIFYLAQSYKDCGEKEKSIEWYKKRAARQDGFYEERYHSQLTVGNLYAATGKSHPETIFEWLKCSMLDITKGEHLAAIITELQAQEQWEAAYIFSSYAVKQFHNKNPYPGRVLFLNSSIYSHELLNLHIKSCRATGRTNELSGCMNIEEAYNNLCLTTSDINEHLPTLRLYAEKYDHITEMGMRYGVSTHAFIAGKPITLISYDLNTNNIVPALTKYAADNNVNFKFIQADVLKIKIDKTDVLFIDTLHNYAQLAAELKLHADKVKHAIIFHDTTAFAFKDEFGDARVTGRACRQAGLRPAIEQFLETNTDWEIRKIYDNNNGLTVMEKYIDKSNERVSKFPMGSSFGKWNDWYKDVKDTEPTAFRYAETISYVKAAEFLSDVKQVEDWGCGLGGFKNHCTVAYTGIDGSNSPFADKIVDLCEYTSTVEGIMIRHVLDHNYMWKKILVNAVRSFTKKMCLVLFTPFSENTIQIAHNLRHGVDVPDISFSKDDITDCLVGCNFRHEQHQTATGYGVEHIFYIEKQDVLTFPKFGTLEKLNVTDKVAVITAIFGGYDNLNEPCALNQEADFYCFTDRPLLSSRWKVINSLHHTNDSNDISRYNSLSISYDARTISMMSAKYYKVNSHKVPELAGYKYIIWVDGSFHINNPDFVKNCLNEITVSQSSLTDHPSPLTDHHSPITAPAPARLAALKHWFRTTIKDEAAACADFNDPYIKDRYFTQKISEQYNTYVSHGFEDDKGMYACGLLVKENTGEINFFMDMWWREIQKYSYQDQISFQYLCWLLNMSPVAIDKDTFNSFQIITHNNVGFKTETTENDTNLPAGQAGLPAPAPAPATVVDVCILSNAKTEDLQRVTEESIRTLLKSETGIKFNVFVVEGNKNVEYDFPGVITLYTWMEFNYNAYMNYAIEQGKAPYVALCNNDLEYTSGWAGSIIQEMKADPTIMSASPFCPGVNTLNGSNIHFGYTVRKELNGWCIFTKRELFDTIGMLDEGVKFWYSDNIFADQLIFHGMKHALIQNSIVLHHLDNLGVTGKTLDGQQQFENTNGQYENYLKARSKYIK